MCIIVTWRDEPEGYEDYLSQGCLLHGCVLLTALVVHPHSPRCPGPYRLNTCNRDPNVFLSQIYNQSLALCGIVIR